MVKTMGGFLPKGPEAEEAQRRLEEAQKALAASEAQLAQALGYELCKCTFPPIPMLSKGYHERHDVEIFECPNCRKQKPSAHKIRQFDEVDAYNRDKRAAPC